MFLLHPGERVLDLRETLRSHEIRMRRDRSLRKLLDSLVGFFDEGSAHIRSLRDTGSARQGRLHWGNALSEQNIPGGEHCAGETAGQNRKREPGGPARRPTHKRRRGASDGSRSGSMHQESKIVELRRAGAGVDPARDKPGIAPAIMPSELTEDLRWVLREIRGAEAIRPEGGVLHQTGKRRSAATWLMAGLIAIGALVCIAAGNRHPFAWAW